MDIKSLCLKLAEVDTEEEVIKILKDAGFWSDSSCWKFFNNEENNFDRIGNQQSSPDAALVEKLINSIDAMLIRQCLLQGIHPEDKSKAPESIPEATEMFFKITRGQLSHLSASERSELAENICLIATGEKSNPSYCIIDHGEGQRPNRIESTFLSLSKQNKLRIPFVQGKFNMGGTGVLQFCGRSNKANNLQLLITRRHPALAEKENDDATKNNWSFTIIRRENPREGRKSSVYTYLTPKGRLLNFYAKNLPLLPGKYPEVLENSMEWGTFIKLYEYQMTGYKTNVILDLYNRLSLLMPNLALPIRMYERRKGYTAHSYESTLAGLNVRLEEDKRENLEEGFPNSSTVVVQGQKMNCSIFSFKKGADEKYRKNEGIIFTINGQTHGYLPKYFFEKKSVGMGYLKDSILVLIDCSNFDGRAREDLFMNSRDRLREGDLKKEIEDMLEELIRQHPGLKALRERRRREEIEDKLRDQKPLADVMDDLIKKAPTLSHLFIKGFNIKNPFNLKKVGETAKPYVGKLYPTYFKLVSPRESETKICHIKSRFRAQFETDARNDYFKRDELPGKFSLFLNGLELKDYTLNLWNGMATLSASLPENTKISDSFDCLCLVSDESSRGDIENKFKLIVEKELPPTEGGNGQKRRPPEGKGDQRKEEEGLSLPNIIEIRQSEWDKHLFDKYSALKVVDSGDSGYDFYINVDNLYLLNEIKVQPKTDPKILEARYKYALVLVGLSILKDYNDQKEKKEEDGVYEKIKEFSRIISPVLLPMISSLGDLEIAENPTN